MSAEKIIYYDAGLHPRQAEMLCQRGAVDREIAEFFGVPNSTFYKWRNTHPEFAAALIPGKAIADDRVERSLYNRAIGYDYDSVKIVTRALGDNCGSEIVEVPYVEHVPPDVKAAIRWLEARRPEVWRRTMAHTGPGGGPIQLSDAETDFSGLSQDECNELRTLLERAAGSKPGEGQS